MPEIATKVRATAEGAGTSDGATKGRQIAGVMCCCRAVHILQGWMARRGTPVSGWGLTHMPLRCLHGSLLCSLQGSTWWLFA